MELMRVNEIASPLSLLEESFQVRARRLEVETSIVYTIYFDTYSGTSYIFF